MLPSADGRFLYSTGRSVYGPELRAPDADGFPDRSIRQVPAVQGTWYALVRGPEFPFGENRAVSISLFQVGKNAPAVTFDAADDVNLARDEQPIDQSVILVPAARVLVTVAAPKRNKLVLRRVELK